MNYFITDIAEITGGKIIHHSTNSQQNPVEHLLIDSRKIIYPESSLFVAIKGERNDGHKYISEVYEAGVKNFLIEKHSTPISIPFSNDVNVVSVDNALMALQQLSAHHRKNFRFPVIGITGSNGKTVVKEWLFQLLKEDINIVRSPKSFNSQVGVPLSVWQMNASNQLGIFEAGISRKGEMEKLQKIIQPTIGIFTYLGSAHDEGFHSAKEKLSEKLKLFSGSELLIYSVDQKDVEEDIAQFLSQQNKIKKFTWSKINRAAEVVFETEIKNNFTSIRTRKGSQILGINIPFTDEASVSNACTCLAFLMAINRISTDILKRFEELQPVEMRLQLKEGINNCIVINDSYSADLNALQIALDFMQQQSSGLSKTVILSDFLETGIKDKELYTSVSKLLFQNKIHQLIGIGPQLNKHKSLFNLPARFFETPDEFILSFKSLEFNHQVILLKGARKFQFEKISSLLEKKIHETVFEINLNALVNNLNFYRRILKPETKIMAMVKAFSYGAGSYEIARVLEFNRVDYLTVAYADEGVNLRKAGIKTPIMVMNPEASAFDEILGNNLEPEIYNFFILEQLIKACGSEEVSIHIELDCGMKRLGFDEKEIDELIKILKQNPNIRIRSIFAHLAASEEKKHDEFTYEQIAAFKRTSEKLCSAFRYPVFRHILNSSGIVRFPEAQFDMVRLGIGLYGIDPSQKIQKHLEQIGNLKTVISQLRKIKSHETIGYSRKGTVNTDSKIATVAIGYADGLNRKLGNGKGYMLINGQRAPVIGS
ncbi:MAG: bifunctional UDP-N-acetylmuramoyl-tripeptide:D-alanyl-D-alanine ligase/alanine racemase, partial [Bacteroidia bacterium]